MLAKTSAVVLCAVPVLIITGAVTQPSAKEVFPALVGVVYKRCADPPVSQNNVLGIIDCGKEAHRTNCISTTAPPFYQCVCPDGFTCPLCNVTSAPCSPLHQYCDPEGTEGCTPSAACDLPACKCRGGYTTDWQTAHSHAALQCAEPRDCNVKISAIGGTRVNTSGDHNKVQFAKAEIPPSSLVCAVPYSLVNQSGESELFTMGQRSRIRVDRYGSFEFWTVKIGASSSFQIGPGSSWNQCPQGFPNGSCEMVIGANCRVALGQSSSVKVESQSFEMWQGSTLDLGDHSAVTLTNTVFVLQNYSSLTLGSSAALSTGDKSRFTLQPRSLLQLQQAASVVALAGTTATVQEKAAALLQSFSSMHMSDDALLAVGWNSNMTLGSKSTLSLGAGAKLQIFAPLLLGVNSEVEVTAGTTCVISAALTVPAFTQQVWKPAASSLSGAVNASATAGLQCSASAAAGTHGAANARR